MNLQHFDRALYERASRRKSKGFDRAFYDLCLEERRAGGHSSSAAAIAGSKHSASGGTPLTILTGGTVAGWYRADLGATGSSTCTALTDQSTGGHNMVLATNGPTINAADGTFGGKQTFTFTGSSCQLYTNGGFTLSVPATVYLICNPTAWASGGQFIGQTGGGGFQIVYAGSSPGIYMNNGTYANGANGVLGSWCRIRAKYTGSGSDAMRVGAAAGTLLPGSAGSGSLTSLSLAPFGTNQFGFNELVVAPWLTSGTEDTNMDSYFVGRFGSLLV